MSKMCKFSWLVSFAALIIVAVIPAANGTSIITEPGRQTKIYGKDFFVVVPLTAGIPEEGSVFQIACVSCSGTSVTGSIALLQGNFSASFNACPTISVSLDISALEPLANETTPAIFNVTADANITVSVIIKVRGALTAFTAIPLASLDLLYLVASYGLKQDLSELTVVAHEDDTLVRFMPNSSGVTIRGDSLLSTNLTSVIDTGEWVEYRTVGSFMGGKLEANKSVSVIVGTRCKRPRQGCPLTMEQLYPLVSLGTKYTAVPVTGVSNIFRAVAVWDNTTISFGDSNEDGSTLNNGQVVDLTLKETGYIDGSKPFLLLHHITMGVPVLKTATVTVPPAEQFTHETVTFSTYLGADTNNITITAPCKYIESISISMHIAGRSSVSSAVKKRSSEEGYCALSRPLEAATYAIWPDNSPDAVYSATLYGRTDQSVFAYILATELNQVTCSVDYATQEVQLCNYPMSTVTATDFTVETSAVPDNEKSTASGTIVAVVIAAISISAGCAVMGICLYRYWKGKRWRRLDESEYMEDNPIRMQELNLGCRM